MSSEANPPAIVADRCYDAAAVRRIMCVSDMTIRRWTEAGAFPRPIQPGGQRGRRLWRGQDLRAHLDKMGSNATAK